MFDLIRKPFGWLIHWFYELTGSYLIAILVFAVVLKIVLFPFGIKQQKNSQKQASLRPKENVIRKKYAGRTDRQTQLKMNTEIQEMYQKENYSPFGGCLPLILQMIVLLAVYAVVRMPLTYTADIDKATIDEVQATVAQMAYEDEDETTFRRIINLGDKKFNAKNVKNALKDPAFVDGSEITAINYIHDNEQEFAKKYEENYKKATEVKDEESDDEVENKTKAEVENETKAEIEDETKAEVENETKAEVEDETKAEVENEAKAEPEKESKDEAKGEKKADEADEIVLVAPDKILESIPDLEVFDGFDLGIIPGLDVLKEEKLGTKLLILIPVFSLITAYLGQALTRKFSYQPPQADETKSQMRMMNIFMPLFSLFIATQVSAGVGVYWIMSNVLSPVQQFTLSKLYPIKEITPEEMREAERLYGGKQKKKKGNTATSGKRKSLVYDDDDEYESVSTVTEKKVVKEKKEPEGNSIVEKAPLKDDKKD